MVDNCGFKPPKKDTRTQIPRENVVMLLKTLIKITEYTKITPNIIRDQCKIHDIPYE